MASTKLTRTPSSAGNRKTYTISMWIKGMGLGSQKTLLDSNFGGGSNEHRLLFKTGSNLEYYDYASSAYQFRYITNRLFRDVNAWYHIVCSVDTTQATASDRVKIYINGVQETSFSTETQPSQNLDTSLNTANLHQFGTKNTGADYFDGSMSHIHFIDGTAYDASAFGQYDANGVWTIKTSPSVTYGTNGFFILKDGNSVTDQSGNGNNFTVGGGTLTNTEDNPSNVFATLNPLNVPTSNAPTFSNGNTTSVTSSTTGIYQFGGTTTLGMTSGKYYIEAKATVDATYSRNVLLITGEATTYARTNSTSLSNSTITYASEGGEVRKNGTLEYTGSTYTTGDIIQIALDLDNGYVYFGKNNTWQNSGDPTSGATGTGGVSTIDISSTTDGAYFFGQGDNTGTSSPSKFDFNFGNGYFGTTPVASAGTNASGNGIFEYDVPTGYTALSTKGLNL